MKHIQNIRRPRGHAVTMTVLALVAMPFSSFAIDADGDGLNDVWEMIYGAQSLAASGDADGDGATNGEESRAGTNPFDPNSRPSLTLAPWAPTQLQIGFSRVAGKRYKLESKTDLSLANWTTEVTEIAPIADQTTFVVSKPAGSKFWRIAIDDVDGDGDGVLDAEERWLGFDPSTTRTARNDTLDLARVNAGLAAASVVTVATLDPRMSERWPDPAAIVVRRSGGLKPITVNIAFSGTATRNADYSASIAGTTVSFGAGVREVPVELTPIADANDAESAETIVITALAGSGYTLGAGTTGTVTLENETATSLPSAKAAARFLIQAAFGPDQDSGGDADDVPENVEEVMAMGFPAWIEDQLARPANKLQPWVDWASVNGPALQMYGRWLQHAWWNRAMGIPKLRPDDAGNVAPDPLRQRVAFALSEILVVSDRPESLAVEPRGVTNYYDLMVKHATGNFRDLLFDVAMHPAMGIYLSHLGNQKADPVNRIYPDENFAREIMQLFSIGLWRLNPDGSRYLSNGSDLDPAGNIVPAGQPIATYGNGDITELARVFTGQSFGNNASFSLYPRDFTVPMKIWDDYHDCGAKTLLGLAIPARTPSAGNTGTAGLADVNAAIDNLFNHPNVGPFIGKQLIQRFVTSNPSPGYISRISAAFANNGSGVRGDMKSVIRAILLDDEARNPAMMSQPTFGKLREPLLRVVNFARAFNATSPSGWIILDQMAISHGQDPANAPSVFNFFLPAHSPPGALTQMGLVAPEFQIINASTAVTGANYFWEHILNDLHQQGSSSANNAVRLNLNEELAMIVPAAQIAQDVPSGPAMDPDPLIRRLDLALTGGTLPPRQYQIIREAMLRINSPTWQWHRERFRIAVYLITTSADFNVQR